jgi:ABC-type spermidine/putrescine transport system permease subunit I
LTGISAGWPASAARDSRPVSPAVRAPRPWTLGRGYLPLLPLPCGFLAVFFIWPLLRVVLRSVLEPRPGFANYDKVLFSGPYLQILFYTLEIAALVTAICLLVAYPVAALIARMQGLTLRLMTGLIIASLWTSAVIRSYAWMILFQRYGIVNQALIALGLADAPVRILQTTAAVAIGMVHILLPFMLLPLITTMRRIDPTLLRAGRILGAGPVRLFLRVYLPLSRPGVNAGVALVFITSLGFFITPSLLGGGRTTMAAMIIEQEADTYLDWPLASAIATILLVLTLAIYLAYGRLARIDVTRGLR